MPCQHDHDRGRQREPLNAWRSHGHLFISNWINHIYQTSPHDISKIGEDQAANQAPDRVARTG
jgi:homoserine O-succinyltransferase